MNTNPFPLLCALFIGSSSIACGGGGGCPEGQRMGICCNPPSMPACGYMCCPIANDEPFVIDGGSPGAAPAAEEPETPFSIDISLDDIGAAMAGE